MVEYVQKRDGSIVDYDLSKIALAIGKAGNSTNEFDKKTTNSLTKKVDVIVSQHTDNTITVEEIQDIVEATLLASKYKQSAKSYILYRDQHAKLRNVATVVADTGLMDQYLDKTDWQVNENSNMTYSLQGLNNYISSEVTKKYWLNKVYPKNIRDLHSNGDIHIHDLNTLAVYCVGWDLHDLLVRGYGGVPGKIFSSPAKHLRTTLGQAVNFLYTLQGECYSDDTEVLTDSGWKFFNDLLGDEKFITLNIETKDIELQYASEHFKYFKECKLINFRNSRLDLLVTEDHKMVILEEVHTDDMDGYNLNFIKAKDFNPSVHFIPNDFSVPTYESDLFKIDKESINYVDYAGYVYCVEVPNHTLYVRRNGKATWCGNCAGAQAFSNFDTLLAPFIRYDNLTYEDVKQAMQEFVFNVNVPTRVGFQCLSEDTEILTHDGWKSYSDIHVGTVIATFNLETRYIEYLPALQTFSEEYTGKMYNIKNRITDQLISPRHNVVRKKFSTEDTYVLEPIEDILNYKSDIIFPVSAANGYDSYENEVSDEWVKLLAWIIADGTHDTHGNSSRITIYQSKESNLDKYNEIKELIECIGLKYVEVTLHGTSNILEFNSESTDLILDYFGVDESKGINFIPDQILHLNKEQSKIFLETYMKVCGCEELSVREIIKDGLMMVAVNAGYGITSHLSKRDEYTMELIKHNDSYVSKIEEVEYSGIIWCPTTKNQTVVARRNGKVFITGNSPFSNITMDLKVPPQFKDLPVIIGGKPQNETYSEFQPEMDIINSVFTEVMTEGDSMGSIFTFPIPTYNITKDFDWDNKNLDGLWEMTAKYGIPYFSNFINSDMKPEDARSMAILGNQELIYKRENGHVSRCPVKRIVSNWIKYKEKPNIKILMNGEFIDIIDMFEVPYENYKSYVSIELDNGYIQNFSDQHKCAAIRDGKLIEVESQDVKATDKFLISKKGYEGNPLLGDYQSGKILGYYLGEGWKESMCDGCISFAININRRDIVDEINDFFIKMVCNVKIVPWEDKHIYKVTVSGKQALGFVKNFIRGEKAIEKRLESSVWNTSLEFRKGLLEGLYQTDGHIPGKILTHTTNKNIIMDLIHLANSVGKILRYRINDKNSRYFKKDKSDLIRFTSYKLYFAEYNETFELDGEEYVLIPVKAVTEHDSKASKVYNFTVNTDRHLYELPNGIITHQCCRLRLDTKTLEKRGGGLFGANPLTGCYSSDTEVLTDEGWKLFTELNHNEKVLSRDTETGIASWNKPTEYFEYDYTGNMIHFTNKKGLDLLVTPDHRMLIEKASGSTLIKHAKDVIANDRIPKKCTIKTCGISEDDIDFYNFAVAFSSDGSLRNRKNSTEVILCAKKDKKLKLYKQLAENLKKYRVNVNKSGVIIYSKELEERLQKECYINNVYSATNKKLPNIWNANDSQMEYFMEILLNGDGHIRKDNGQKTFYSVSKTLADDVQKMALYSKMSATIVSLKLRESTTTTGRVIRGREIPYVVYINKSNTHRLRKYNIKNVDYNGKVYCLKVANGIFYVRRNGRACWSGNSIGVVTVNLPRLGFTSSTKDEFMAKVLELVDVASESLEIKRKVLENYTEQNLYPYIKHYLRDVHNRYGQYWKNHFSTIGIVGMNEACLNLIGEDITSENGMALSLELCDVIRNRLIEIQEATGNNYNFEATPAEGTSYRLALMDKKKYPGIICANESDYVNGAEPFYTNSTQLPVNFTDDIFEVFDLQDDLQQKYTGGTVIHIFIGEKINDHSVVKNLVKKLCENYHTPYFTITPTFSICPSHGYISGNHDKCPTCDGPTEVYSRVTGYVRPINQWNAGKKEEFKNRTLLKV